MRAARRRCRSSTNVPGIGSSHESSPLNFGMTLPKWVCSFLQRVAQGEDEPELARHAVALVGQDREGELLLLDVGQRVVGRLRRDGDELRAEVVDRAKHALVGAQLQVAERAPAAAVERDDRRAPREQRRQGHGLAVRVGQREVGSLRAHLQRAAGRCPTPRASGSRRPGPRGPRAGRAWPRPA